MSLEAALTFTLTMTLFALTPGPGMLAIVARALASGFWTGFGFILGIVLADMAFVLLAVFGLGLIAEALGGLFLIVKIAGGAYLIWLGWKAWTAPVLLTTVAGQSTRRGLLRATLEGIAITLGNPKVIVFYGALLPTFFDLTALGSGGIVTLMAIVGAVVLVTNSAIALAASRARTSLRSPKAVRWINRGAGTAMIGAGIAVATR